MHDAKGRELKVGDVVMIPCRVKRCCGDENFCCLDVETVGVMPGNGCKNYFGALSTKQVYRANEGDDVTLKVIDGRDLLA